MWSKTHVHHQTRRKSVQNLKPSGIIRMSERNQHKLHKIIFFYRCREINWSSRGKEVKNCCISVFERFSSDNRNISTINNAIEAIYEKAKVG